MVGGVALTQKNLPGPHAASENQLLQRRCDARLFKPLPIEIVARQKVASAFEPQ
jgi:hypothetical protein